MELETCSWYEVYDSVLEIEAIRSKTSCYISFEFKRNVIGFWENMSPKIFSSFLGDRRSSAVKKYIEFTNLQIYISLN